MIKSLFIFLLSSEVENILKGSLHSIPSPSSSRDHFFLQNIKFVDSAQQCFAFTPQANFPTHNSIFTEGEDDGIESRLPLKIFSTLTVHKNKK